MSMSVSATLSTNIMLDGPLLADTRRGAVALEVSAPMATCSIRGCSKEPRPGFRTCEVCAQNRLRAAAKWNLAHPEYRKKKYPCLTGCGAEVHRRGRRCYACYALVKSAIHERRRVPADVRFWAKVNRDGPIPPHMPHLGQCWIWTARRKKYGYGSFGTDSYKVEAAHRVSWQFANGDIPPGLNVCHHCDNPPCVRPDHLFLGTNYDNAMDRERKGRGNPKGVRTRRVTSGSER